MVYSGFGSEFVRRVGASAASREQFYLLQGVARALDPGAPAVDHAATKKGVAASVMRLHSALSSFSEYDQPAPTLLEEIRVFAAFCVDAAIRFEPSDATLSSLRSLLVDVEFQVTGPGIVRTQRRLNAGRLFELSKGDVSQLPEMVRAWFIAGWSFQTQCPEDWLRVSWIRDESASYAGVVDRDPMALEQDIANLFLREVPDAQHVWEVVCPSKIKFHAACVVSGAFSFEGLRELDQSARQWRKGLPVADAGFGWGPGMHRLRSFLEQIPSQGAHAVVGLTVEASDVPSAARVARKRFEELLDQYMAGQRSLRVAILPDILMNTVGTQQCKVEAKYRSSIRAVNPLVVSWPRELRFAIRLGHLARSIEAPLASAGMASAALDACGLAWNEERENIARTLALHAFRRQVVYCHQLLRASAKADLDACRADIFWRERDFRRLEVAENGMPDGLEARQAILAELATSSRRLSEARAKLSEKTSATARNFESIGRAVAAGNSGALVDVNAWVALLLSDEAVIVGDKLHALLAMKQILANGPPLAAVEVEQWINRLLNPAECLNWIEDFESRVRGLLAALYNARNQVFHSGTFDSFDDLLLRRAGLMLVDFTFEVLGNWYRKAGPLQVLWGPGAVFSELGSRCEDLKQEMRAGTAALDRLDVESFTGP